MHVSKFQLGIPNGCCVTKAQVKHVLVTRRHAGLVRGNPLWAKFAAENTAVAHMKAYKSVKDYL